MDKPKEMRRCVKFLAVAEAKAAKEAEKLAQEAAKAEDLTAEELAAKK
jgi:23S rRNA (uracil1939-C5)-methyltransferase